MGGQRRTVMVVSASAPVHWLRVGDMIDGGVTVPGFRCAIGDLFDGLAEYLASDAVTRNGTPAVTRR